MSEIDPRRLQRHVRETLRAQSQPTRVGPFTCFFHPDAPYAELNVAVPDDPVEGRRVPVLGQEAAGVAAVPDDDPEYALMMVEAQFRARKRVPRVELVAECHPSWPSILEKAGFRQAASVPLLVSTEASWRSAPEVPGMLFEAVLPTTAWGTVKRYLEVQRDAFGLAMSIPDEAPHDPWSALGIGAGVLASIEGVAVGAGGFTAPREGLCEIRGLAVSPDARRRGIGTFLLSALARVAHDGGIEGVVATPDGPRTARMAKRAGYVPSATLLAFTAEDAAAP
ncbi:MAG TPA: GNAT family N-acetyltransferase [Candidatus Thermoplasmatota archaeon]|nr:GNAT family N-acetyltransferase [Candidatus Thermoplasmatota archaeon]